MNNGKKLSIFTVLLLLVGAVVALVLRPSSQPTQTVTPVKVSVGSPVFVVETRREGYHSQDVLYSNNTAIFTAMLGHMNYKDGEDFRKIDMRPSFATSSWKASQASYAYQLPEYADGLIEFLDKFEGKSQQVQYFPLCDHIKGVIVEQEWTHTVVEYPGACNGHDLILTADKDNLKKDIRISEAEVQKFLQGTEDYLEFEFKTNLDGVSLRSQYNRPNSNRLTMKFDNFVDVVGKQYWIGSTEDKQAIPPTLVKVPMMWDSGNQGDDYHIEPVPIRWHKEADGIHFTKRVPRTFLEKAVGDVFTDTTSTFTVGTGDCSIDGTNATWDTIHDATSGNSPSCADATNIVLSNYTGSIYRIDRAVLPFNTSAISSGDTVSSSSVSIYVNSKSDADTSGIDVVETSQSDHTTLSTGDFDQVGSINNPTQLATRKTISSFSTSAFNPITLNSTGDGKIKKSGESSTCGSSLTGWTCLGLREGRDADDSAPTGSNNLVFQDLAGANDPYLVVEHAAAATIPDDINPPIIWN